MNSALAEETIGSFGVIEGKKPHEIDDKIRETMIEKVISKDFVIQRNAKGEVM